MKKNKLTLIVVIVLLALAIVVFLKFTFTNQIYVHTLNGLTNKKVKIIKGRFTINRKNDKEIFNKPSNDIIYNGFQNKLLFSEYGENDFLIIYDDKYYYQFRHYIFNRNNHFSYNYTFFKKNNFIYLKTDIQGDENLHFTLKMNPINNARNQLLNKRIK